MIQICILITDAGGVDIAFNNFHLAKVLETFFPHSDLDAAIKKCAQQDAAAFTAVYREGNLSNFETILVLASCRPHQCQSAADFFLWLVEMKIVKRADLEPWRAVYKGQTAKDVASRLIARFRPDSSMDALSKDESFGGCRSNGNAAVAPNSEQDQAAYPEAVESAVNSEEHIKFAKGLLKIGDQDAAEDEMAQEALSALCRNQELASVEASSVANLFREGHDDEYEALVQVSNLQRRGWGPGRIVQVMPDVLRFSRGLPAPPALQLRASGGTVCCDLEELRRHLRAELGATLVDGPNEEYVLGLELGALRDGGDSNSDSDGDEGPDPLIVKDPGLLLRMLTAYASYGGDARRLFVDEPETDTPACLAGIDAARLKAFECCVCLKIMRDPASLGCGHSACLRCVSNRLLPTGIWTWSSNLSLDD